MTMLMDGYWLPHTVRERLQIGESEYDTLAFAQGRPCRPGDEGAVAAQWPVVGAEQWPHLLDALRANRPSVPQGQAFGRRFQAALAAVARRLADPKDPMHQAALSSLPGYTGYSAAMIRFTLGALELWALDALAAALSLQPTKQASAAWQPMAGLAGRLRFYPEEPWQRMLGRLDIRGGRPLFGPPCSPELVVGYGAGNVPGTALLIAFLALASTLAGGAPPVTVVRNSRHEPIFAPLVLSGLEAEDPELVSAVTVLVWEYEDPAVQRVLLPQADLVIAAAGDETIAQIGGALGEMPASSSPHKGGRKDHSGSLHRAAKTDTPGSPTQRGSAGHSGCARFHAHGHKVSFSAIGREMLARGRSDEVSGQSLLDVVALLAALDSVFWDQHGCLSSRIHFVETGTPAVRSTPSAEGGSREDYTPREYAERLADQMQILAGFLPRGAWPYQRLHDRFDRYKLLETTGLVQVLSCYDDPFVVALDQRTLDAAGFHSAVNECEGRVILVRPVGDLMEVPERFLRLLPAANLQSLSVAVGKEGEGLTERFLLFAEACGRRGVTALRTVGRGAFPQLAYSWDGLIPLDLVRQRPAGRFATIEFDRPYDEMVETYHLLVHRGASHGWEVD